MPSKTALAGFRVGLLLLLLGQNPLSAQSKYSFTTIDFPGAIYIEPRGINNAGQIVGTYQTSDFNFHGFLSSDGKTCDTVKTNCTTIDFPGAPRTWVTGINNVGQIVGYYESLGGGDHAFVLWRGTFSTIDVPGTQFTHAFGINDTGQIIGTYIVQRSDAPVQGFLFSGGSITTVNICQTVLPLEPRTYLQGINNAGAIVGYCTNGDDIPPGFLLSGSTSTFIGFTPSGVNSSGQIVGNIFPNGIILTSGTSCTVVPQNCTSIAFPGARRTTVNGINDKGLAGCRKTLAFKKAEVPWGALMRTERHFRPFGAY